MRTVVVVMSLAAVAACAEDGTPGGARQALNGPLTLYLASSNVAELNGSSDVTAPIAVVGGDTEIEIVADPEWPVANAFAGFDRFYYSASFVAHPVLRVRDGACDEVVVGGEACGWMVNTGSCLADGFGCFDSLATRSPAGTGASSGRLVFTIQGTPALLPNDHGGRVAVHGRFDAIPGSQLGCSAWLSDGVAGSVISAPGCVPVVQPDCSLTVDPAELVLVRGGSRSATITTTATGVESLSLGLEPSPPPAGLGFVFVPNPVVPSASAQLTVTAGPGAPQGSYPVEITGEGGGASCHARLVVTVVEAPGCACP